MEEIKGSANKLRTRVDLDEGCIEENMHHCGSIESKFNVIVPDKSKKINLHRQKDTHWEVIRHLLGRK